jgi:hypothetical protein
MGAIIVKRLYFYKPIYIPIKEFDWNIYQSRPYGISLQNKPWYEISSEEKNEINKNLAYLN